MLRILEEKGLIVRELGNEDRRQMYFHLSSTGKQRVSELEVDKVEMPDCWNLCLNKRNFKQESVKNEW